MDSIVREFYSRYVTIQKPEDAWVTRQYVNAEMPGNLSEVLKKTKQANMKALRGNLIAESKQVKAPLTERMRQFFKDAISEAFRFSTPKEANRMCLNYGHTIDHKSWSKGMPNCADCGKRINGPEDLRKSNPLESTL